MITGYLGCGRVETVGAQVSGFAPGDPVFYTRTRMPEPYEVNWMGAHVSRALLKPGPQAPYVLKLPEAVYGPGATMLGLAAVSYRGTQMMSVNVLDTALVTGQGMIGQPAAQILRARGARVMTADMMPLRVGLSAKWSADEAVNVAERDLVQAAKEFAPCGFDLVVDTSGSNAVVNQIYPLMHPRGQLLLQGWYPGDISFDFQLLHQYRPTIHVSCSQSLDDTIAALDLVNLDRLHLDPLVSHVIPYRQAPEAYQNLLEAGQEQFLGVTIDWRAS